VSGQRYVAKLIKPYHMSQVRVDEGVVRSIIQNPRPDIAVVYRESWGDPEGLVILMEEHQFSLRRWIVNNTIWYEFDWFPVMSGLAIRLALAHALGAVHKDLKPSNSSSIVSLTESLVLVDRNPDGRFEANGIHLSDFGIPYCHRLPIDGQPMDVPGTAAYLAPEVLRYGESKITTSSDIWAVGCIGYELCLGLRLAGNRPLLKKHINNGQGNPKTMEALIASIPQRFGDKVRKTIRACLEWEPTQRCPANELRDFLLQQGV
jgi:serine/threonine protein kinase